MRLLIISVFFPPLNAIASLRPYSWAKYWAEAGHHVTVLTTKKTPDQDCSLSLPKTHFEVIEVPLPRWIHPLKETLKKAPSPSNTTAKLNSRQSHDHFLGGAKRLLKAGVHSVRERYGIFSSCRMPDVTDLWIYPAFRHVKALNLKWDYVFSTFGPYANHIVAKKIKTYGLASQWVADYRDLWADSVVYPGMFPFKDIERLLEKHLLKHVDKISASADEQSEILQMRHKRHVEVIPNGFDLCDLEVLPKERVFQDKDKFRFVYTGKIYLNKRDPSPLFEAIQTIYRSVDYHPLLEKLEVIFIGEGTANLNFLIKKYRVSKWVKNLGSLPRETALRMQRDASALLFLDWNDNKIRGVVPGKIFEYLYSGTPILSIGGHSSTAATEIISQAQAGLCLGNNVAKICEVLIEKISQFTQGRTWGVKPPSFILEKYDRKNLAQKLLEYAMSMYTQRE